MRFRKKGNQKIQNATPTIYNGVQYRSKLEVYTAKTLEENGLVAEYEKNKFLLQEKFEFKPVCFENYTKKGVEIFGIARDNIQGITYTPDFVDPNFKWLIECKGYSTPQFDLKWKIFKKYLVNNDIMMDLYLPKNQKQVRETIELIKNKSYK